jgi:hypothetical protein
MNLATRYNTSTFGRWINSGQGRLFRVIAGTGFLAIGLMNWGTPLGIAAVLWSALPLSAGGLDLCWISAALGGPLRGRACRASSPPDRGGR